MEQENNTTDSRSVDTLLFIGLSIIIVAGILMRILYLGQLPAGLYQDEAVNGLDAVSVLNGDHTLYFPDNNGREPLYIYTMAATIAIFGQNELGLRAASAVFGVLAILAMVFCGTALQNRRTGLLSAAILAGLLWHVHLSRVGFRAISMGVLAAFALGLAAWALKNQSRWAALGSGAAYGFMFYTYIPARFSPLALVLIGVYGWLFYRQWLLERWSYILWMALASVIVVTPLVFLTVTQPELVFGRGEQVAIWNSMVHQGNFFSTLLTNAINTLGMFFWRGDWIWRHNVPYRPVFDPLMGGIFLSGVAVVMLRPRTNPALSISMIWVVVMLLPTLLAADAPHFLRAAGILPVVVLIPAITIDRVMVWAKGCQLPAQLPSLLVVVFLSISTGMTIRDYFGCCYQSDPVRGYFFQQQAQQLATELNHSPSPIYLPRRYWDSFPSIRYLVHESQELILYSEDEVPYFTQPSYTLVAWPHTDIQPLLSTLPANTTIEVVNGPLSRGDKGEDPYQLYTLWVVREQMSEQGTPLAQFENGLTLQTGRAQMTSNNLMLTLTWNSTSILSSSVQTSVRVYNIQTQELVAQVDEPPGSYSLPPLSWPDESVIIHHIEVANMVENSEYQVSVSLYNSDTMARYTILGSNDESVWLTVND